MQNVAILTLSISSILWGLTWLPLKYLHEKGFDGIAITLLIYCLMTIATLPIVWKYRKLAIQNWPYLIGILLLGGGTQLAFNTSMVYGDVIRAMVLYYLIPFWGVIGGRIFLKEKITPLRFLGMGFALLGVFLVEGGMSVFTSPVSWVDLTALLSGLLFAMNNIVYRASPNLPIMLKLHVMFIGAAFFAAITIGMMTQQPAILPDVSFSAWLILLGFALIWMLTANFGTQWAVTHIESGKSSIILILELFTAVVSAHFILNETLQGLEVVGGILILAAAMMETLPLPKTNIRMSFKYKKSS
ncbi:DMT family transporter [Hydrogenovibrio sp. JE_KL2]|uniref:DMT family transporter n=1 Tax=Hydrogenovibrio sp. JE_KL2 TaxID=2651188 RepID=UPI00128D5436|nr:DMT family transporter [Hydrogenovibrio sp. JE_KL2]MPQ77446.1 DMT family transporter [Hydrogenovibrio sp. JE_KL2]